MEEALGRARGRTAYDPVLEILAERGRAYEKEYADYLTSTGREVSFATDVASTQRLIAAGADVIAQAQLTCGRWHGRADFLVRTPSSVSGRRLYEIHETKLSAESRAESVLQLCVYADLLSAMMGYEPEFLVLVKKGAAEFEQERLRFAEYSSIYRLLRNDLESHDGSSSPEPRSNCDTCRWFPTCDAEWRTADHLALVAGSGASQRRELEERDISTMKRLSVEPRSPLSWKPIRGQAATYEKLAHQAELQVEARGATDSPPPVHRLEPLPGRGLARLPLPSPGDVFLDLEGDPFIGRGGREFLFGWVVRENNGFSYHSLWALDEANERTAFLTLLRVLKDSVDVDPGMHIYHFSPYEPTALKRLMGRHAVGDEVVSLLLREHRFVDLMSVARQSLRIGIESYNLKALEAVTGYVRQLGLREAGISLRRMTLALQRGDLQHVDECQHAVEQYNEDDCRSTVSLRAYLEEIRQALVSEGKDIERPCLPAAELDEEKEAKRGRVKQLCLQLRTLATSEMTTRLTEQAGVILLADILEYYERERKADGWEFYRLADLGDEDRFDEASAISGLVYIGRIDRGKGRSSAPLDRYKFLPQELKIGADSTLFVDAKTRLGRIERIDVEQGVVDIQKAKNAAELHPSSCFEHTYIPAGVKEDSLLREAEFLLQSGFVASSKRSLFRDLLLRMPPRRLPLYAGQLRKPNELASEAACRLVESLDGTVLPIQGPPGTGKTETAARMILELVKRGKKVGVMANGYSVISNLLRRTQNLAQRSAQSLRVAVRSGSAEKVPEGLKVLKKAEDADAAMSTLDVLGATAWHWSRPEGTHVDVLIIDEAGQVSLADVLAVCHATANLVLVGDPQQLDQPIRAAHPAGSSVSVLEHLLQGEPTIDPSRGLLLDRTHRLPQRICAYTAEQFYRGELLPADSQASGGRNNRNGGDSGQMLFIPVVHEGNQNSSREEAAAIATLIDALNRGDSEILNRNICFPVKDQDILVVAPFNAHVTAIRSALNVAGHPEVNVGTVDKFQGQEAPIAIYAMATSHPDDAPRGIEFLYSRHRLNVATSRAQRVAILVASPALLRPNCRTPGDLRLANALCRFVELAQIMNLPQVTKQSRVLRV